MRVPGRIKMRGGGGCLLKTPLPEIRKYEQRGDDGHGKGRGRSPGPRRYPEKGSRYELLLLLLLALILRSICPIRVSRSLLCFSNSRTSRSCSAERPSSLSEISSTVNPS